MSINQSAETPVLCTNITALTHQGMDFAVVSGIETLATDPLSPLSYKVGPPCF